MAGDDHREPRCERCRYPTRGLPTLICPECGTDLRITGISTPDVDRGQRSLDWVLIIPVSVFVALGYGFTGYRLGRFMPGRPKPWKNSSSSGRQSFSLYRIDTGDYATLTSIAIRNNSPTHLLLLSDNNTRGFYRDRLGVSHAGPFDVTMLNNYLDQLSLDPSTRQSDLTEIKQNTLPMPGWRVNADMLGPWVALLFLAIWILLALQVVSRHKPLTAIANRLRRRRDV